MRKRFFRFLCVTLILMLLTASASAMKLQNNITALNTHRFSMQNSQIYNFVEKLSSGYRVNRAGEEAAGMAISEMMRAAIQELSAMSKNAQDSISLVQTAEGALTEVHQMLQRMSELAVQAAAGTADSAPEADNTAISTFAGLLDENTILLGLSYADGVMAAALESTGEGYTFTAQYAAPASGEYIFISTNPNAVIIAANGAIATFEAGEGSIAICDPDGTVSSSTDFSTDGENMLVAILQTSILQDGQDVDSLNMQVGDKVTLTAETSTVMININEAINQYQDLRSSLGTLQNQLDNILLQHVQAMLMQANETPQNASYLPQ